jgi:hypothetical protein
MSGLRYIIGFAAFMSAILTCMTVGAFFEWRISELFSNADGTVQFIEFQSLGSDEGQAAEGQIRSMSTGKTVTLTENLSGSTLNKKLLLATAAFGALPGAVAPDFPTIPLPINFFNPNGDTITIFHHVEIASRSFISVPTDGIRSLNYPGSTLVTNTPTNFASQTGSIDLSATFGDYNDNGSVEAADYVVWRKGGLPLLNDETPGNQPGDENQWRENFDEPSGGLSASGTVPEPATALLLLFAAGGFIRRRAL